jgi:hypothetical protein
MMETGDFVVIRYHEELGTRSLWRSLVPADGRLH